MLQPCNAIRASESAYTATVAKEVEKDQMHAANVEQAGVICKP